MSAREATEAAVLAAEAARQHAVARAEAEFRAAIDALVAARPEAAGPGEMAEIAAAERRTIAALVARRDAALHTAQGAWREAVGPR